MKRTEEVVIRKNLVHTARDNTDQNRSVPVQPTINTIKARVPATNLPIHTNVSQPHTEHINSVRSVFAALAA